MDTWVPIFLKEVIERTYDRTVDIFLKSARKGLFSIRFEIVGEFASVQCWDACRPIPRIFFSGGQLQKAHLRNVTQIPNNMGTSNFSCFCRWAVDTSQTQLSKEQSQNVGIFVAF